MTTQAYGSYSTIVNAKVFFRAIEDAKNEGKEEDINRSTFLTKDSKWFGAYVHTYSVEEYIQTTPILLDNGKAGFALKNGDIISVFKHPKTNLQNALSAIFPLALQLGGNRLDCFNKGLPIMYAKFGFFPVAKIQFDPEYAPSDWNYVRDGQPDIVYMVYQKNVKATAQETIADRARRIEQAVSHLEYTTYDEAIKIQKVYCELWSARAL